MVVPSNLPVEKKFRRLLCAAEKLSEENSMEDWKLQQVGNIHHEQNRKPPSELRVQFVDVLAGMLNDVHKWTR